MLRSKRAKLVVVRIFELMQLFGQILLFHVVKLGSFQVLKHERNDSRIRVLQTDASLHGNAERWRWVEW